MDRASTLRGLIVYQIRGMANDIKENTSWGLKGMAQNPESWLLALCFTCH